jgi:hypothetical protein
MINVNQNIFFVLILFVLLSFLMYIRIEKKIIKKYNIINENNNKNNNISKCHKDEIVYKNICVNCPINKNNINKINNDNIVIVSDLNLSYIYNNDVYIEAYVIIIRKKNKYISILNNMNENINLFIIIDNIPTNYIFKITYVGKYYANIYTIKYNSRIIYNKCYNYTYVNMIHKIKKYIKHAIKISNNQKIYCKNSINNIYYVKK